MRDASTTCGEDKNGKNFISTTLSAYNRAVCRNTQKNQIMHESEKYQVKQEYTFKKNIPSRISRKRWPNHQLSILNFSRKSVAIVMRKYIAIDTICYDLYVNIELNVWTNISGKTNSVPEIYTLF